MFFNALLDKSTRTSWAEKVILNQCTIERFIKSTLSNIPENSFVIINASDTVYIAHDVLSLITEFAEVKANDMNIDVKLEGFKKEYNLENDEYYRKTVTFEQKYNVLKRKVELVRNKI